MRPIKTEKTTGTYGAPRGLEQEIGGLPYYREDEPIGGRVTTSVCSVWTFSADEREAIADGKNLLLVLIGEPIPPVALELTDQTEAT